MMSDELLEAIQFRDVDRVGKLLADGADPNEPGKSRYGSGGNIPPLHAAIAELEAFGEAERGGPIDSVVLLLRYGARVNDWDVLKEGAPLLDAVLMKHIEAVRLLLAAGADPNVWDNRDGASPLPFCAQHGLLEMARLLLQCGATKTIHEGGMPTGMNALGFAATRLNVDMVKLLLEHGADPLIGDFDDMTTFRRLEFTVKLGRVPDDPAAQERLREIRRLLGEPRAEDAGGK